MMPVTLKQTATTSRLLCAACLRAQSGCICRWIVRLPTAIEVLILQHPAELKHSKGSARLLHLCLPNSQLLVGEKFDEQLDASLRQGGKTPILLYPPFAEHGLDCLAPPPELKPADLQKIEQLRLVILDGTWRKSRKMLYLNSALQALPRLSLHAVPESHYRIRKAHGVDQLSSLEACCYALMQLEANNRKYQPLLDTFDGFVNQIEQQSLRSQ